MSGSEFFDQLLAAIAAEEEKHPGRVAPESESCRMFFSDLSPQPPQPAAIPPVREIPPQPEMPLGGSLEALREQVLNCRRCALGKTRRNAVFGEGNPHARLMFIGEGPGADEDAQGRPFVGRAGQLLDKMIAAMQLRREDVYIANVVKCRPPGNRVPLPDEGACCIGFLRRQIQIIRPEVIVLLGATAVKFLLSTPEGITRLRGRWLEYENIPVMPTYHPAFLLRQESAKRDAWSDLKQVMAKLGIALPMPRKR